MDEPTEVRNFVAGRWIRPAGVRASDVWNPATGALIAHAGAGLDDATRDRVEALIAAGVVDGATVLVDGRKRWS
jgi:acyl-CoA reductase-like NAD-dependent aldehyde dehydrogenase